MKGCTIFSILWFFAGGNTFIKNRTGAQLFLDNLAGGMFIRVGTLLWNCMVIGNAGFFLAFGQKLNLPKNPKTRFFPKKLDFRRQTLNFSDNFSKIWPFLHQKIAMNHKISRKKLISDLKTAKNAKTRLSKVKT